MSTLNDIVANVLRPLWGVLAMVTFLGIALWAYWPKNKAGFDHAARLPLDEEL